MSAMRALTYCSNIYPGESWADVRHNLQSHALAVKHACSPTQSFPLGLRLSAQAAFELDDAEIQRFRHWCEAQGCHVLTVNGFPYGAFHGVAVKEAVYQPDWRSSLRVDYTKRLANVLAQWTPPQQASSISTVPIAFRKDFRDDDWPLVRSHLIATLQHLADLHAGGGPLIRLALEPEAHCVLQESREVLAFFERMRLPASLVDYLGLCLDCCHQAVQFEEPADCLAQFAEVGIRIVKVQVSSALRACGAGIADLLQFDEPTYLHQAVLRTGDGRLLRFADLPELAQWLARGERAEECRVHFHVPIFLAELGGVGTTRFFLEDCLSRLDPAIPLEVETYSFVALPPALRLGTLGESIARELNWAKGILDVSHRRH